MTFWIAAPLDPTRLTERAQALLAMPLVEETPEEPTQETAGETPDGETPQTEAA